MINHETLPYGPQPLNSSLMPFQGLIDRHLSSVPEEARLYGVCSLLVARLNQQIQAGQQLETSNTEQLEPKGFAAALHGVLADCSLSSEQLAQNNVHDVPEPLVGRVNALTGGMVAYDVLLFAASAYGDEFAAKVNDAYRIARPQAEQDGSGAYLSDMYQYI